MNLGRLGAEFGRLGSLSIHAGAGGPRIALSASQDTEGDAQGTAIGTLSVSGGTGTYTFTLTDDGGGTTQVAGTNGVNLQVGATAPSVGTVSISVHADNGAGSTLDQSFTIGTVPKAPSVDLPATSDFGTSSTDNITNDNTPDIDVICASTPVAGDVIQRYVDAVLADSITLTSGMISGSTAAPGSLSALSDGTHAITAKHARGSLVSALSSALSITIDTAAPVLSSASGAQDGTTQTQADLSVTTNKGQGTLYWVVTTNSTTPTASQIQLGEDASGSAVAAGLSGSISVSSAGAKTASAIGLTTNTWYAFFVQSDVAGNVSSIVSTSWSQTVASFSPNAVGFDGAVYLRNSAASSIVAGKQGIISLWYKPLASDSTARYILAGRSTTGAVFWLENQTNNRVLLSVRDSGGVTRLSVQSNLTNFVIANGWRHIAIAWDTGAGTAQWYTDGSSDLYSTHTIDGSANLSYPTDIRVGADTTTSPVVQAAFDICELYVNFNETIDLSANISKFISGGAPPSLGSNGSTPTGNQPTVYLGGSHNNTNWQTNLGSCGNFTVTGDALTSVTAP